jgi:hypothetical protein
MVGSEALTVRFFPTVIRENEPFVITVTLNNFRLQPQRYQVSLYVDGVRVLLAEALVEPMSAHLFTYTRASPKIGEALRVYVEALNVETGERHVSYLNVPQYPPELLMGFSAFSSFATSLTSTSSSSTSLVTITYYLNVMGLSADGGEAQQAINTGIIVSMTLILLLIFMELTDPAYGRIGRRILALRGRYGVLAISLLIIFAGIVLTKVVMIIVG